MKGIRPDGNFAIRGYKVHDSVVSRPQRPFNVRKWTSLSGHRLMERFRFITSRCLINECPIPSFLDSPTFGCAIALFVLVERFHFRRWKVFLRV